MRKLQPFRQRVEAALKAEAAAAAATKTARCELAAEEAGCGLKKRRVEVDEEDNNWMEWALSDWRRKESWTQNRRAVELRDGVNVLPPRDGEFGPLHHPRRGGVGWVQDWARGSKAMAATMLVALIKHLNLLERVRDALPKTRAQREDETNAKIVDLMEQGLAETKHCRNEQQRVEYHVGLGYVMPPRLTEGDNSGWIRRSIACINRC